jgi:hypothetical protein
MKIPRPPLLKSNVNLILSLLLIGATAYGAATLIVRASGIGDPTADALAASGLLE